MRCEAPNATALKAHMYNAYDGFADKRIKNLAKSDTFIVDDRSRSDEGADRQLYPWFCLMFARVKGPELIELELSGSVPLSDAIESWIEDGYASWDGRLHSLTVKVEPRQHGQLLELADLMESIVAPGQRYTVKSYKYVCPRTAQSLRRLAETLGTAPRS